VGAGCGALRFERGAVYLALGPIEGEGSSDGAGVSVAGAGDTDGDGALEILIGAPGAPAVYVVQPSRW